jgi:hypothetical protein
MPTITELEKLAADARTIAQLRDDARALSRAEISRLRDIADALSQCAATQTGHPLSERPIRDFPVAFVLTCEDIRNMECADDEWPDVGNLTDEDCHRIGRLVHKCGDYIAETISDSVNEAIREYHGLDPDLSL